MKQFKNKFTLLLGIIYNQSLQYRNSVTTNIICSSPKICTPLIYILLDIIYTKLYRIEIL